MVFCSIDNLIAVWYSIESDDYLLKGEKTLNNLEQAAYISTKEAAGELGMNRVFILGEIHRGELPALKMSKKKYLIKKTDWETYKKSKQTVESV